MTIQGEGQVDQGHTRDERMAEIACKYARSTVEGLVRRNIIGRYMADESEIEHAIADAIKNAIHEALTVQP